MSGKATDTTNGGTTQSSGSTLFGKDGLKGVGSGIQQASQNYLQQQAADNPDAAGFAQMGQALGSGLAAWKNRPVDMTNYVNRPNVIPRTDGGTTPPPNLFVPSGPGPITSPMNGITGLTMHQPVTTPMFNPGLQTQPPITSPMLQPGTGFQMRPPTTSPMFTPGAPGTPITSPMASGGNLFGS